MVYWYTRKLRKDSEMFKSYMYTVSYYDTATEKIVHLSPVFYKADLAYVFSENCNELERDHSGNRVYFVQRESI